MGQGRRALVATAFASLVSAAVVAPAAAQQDSLYSDQIVELRIEHGPDTLLFALSRPDSALLLPLGELLRVFEVGAGEWLAGRRASGRLAAGDIAFGFDTEQHRILKGNLVFPLDPRDAVWRGDELYVSMALLNQLLEIDMAMNWHDMMVLVSVAEQLPVVQRIARERRRAVMLRPGPAEEDITQVAGKPALLDGLAVDWAFTGATRELFDNSSVQLGIGAVVAGGGLDVQYTSVRSPLGTSDDTFWSWTRAWEDKPWLRQLRLGDITTGGPRGVPVLGFNVTNSPFLRSADFATQLLLGRLSPGWDVEVYRGEELVGYAPVGTDGRYGVNIPVVYGQNPLETIAYGPHGEVRRIGQTFVIPFERLPGGRVEYNIGAGSCRGVRCEAAINYDLRYGLSDRLTVQGGLDAFTRDSLSDLFHPYALATVAVTRPAALTAEYVLDGFARGRFDLDPSADFHFDAGYTRFDTTITDPIIGSRLVAQQVDGGLFWRPGAMGGDLFFQGAATWQQGALRTRTGLRASATTRLLGARASLAWHYDADRVTGFTTMQSGLDAGSDGVVARGWLRNTLLRAAVGAECAGPSFDHCAARLSRWTAGLGRQLFRVLRLDAGVRKDAGVSGVSVDISLTMGLPWVRATSRSAVAADGTFNGAQLLEGSVLWNRRQGQVELGSGRNLGRAGIVGSVFFDANGDGVQEPNEPGLNGVSVHVGLNAVVTDSLGRFRAWDLVPFVDAIVEVDTLSLENPLWYPADGAVRVAPSPNAFRFVGIPVRQGGEVNGRVELDGKALPGAALVLTDARGRSHPVNTFTDGTFYIMRLPAGSYELTLDADQAQRIGASGDTVRFIINDRQVRLDDVVVRARRNQ